MNVLIEKDFLVSFSEKNADNYSNVDEILFRIFSDYPEITYHFDQDFSLNEKLFNEYLNKNPVFDCLTNYGEISSVVPDFGLYIRKEDCTNTLIFVVEEKSWFTLAQTNGAICFSLDNYQKKIKEIIDKTHIRVDLSEKFIGWGKLLKEVKVIPTKKIIITDNYILKYDVKIESNLAEILKELIQLNDTSVIVYTDLHQDNLSDKMGKRFKKIKTLVNGSYTLALISSEKDIRDDKCFNLHDRLIYCDYLLIESTQGFNISRKESNSQIIIETIFNKYTYKRRNRHLKVLNSFFKSLQEDNLNRSRFIIYPSNALLT